MEKTFRLTESSNLYRKIDALGLSATARMEAFATLATAERVASALVWLLKHMRVQGNDLKSVPRFNLKHQ